jgi:hypothetical protein
LNFYSKRFKNNKQRKFENKLFRNNEKLFYKNLADNKTQNNNGIPNINEIKEFWSNIWSNEVQFNNQAEWIPNLENETRDSNNRHNIQISLEILVNSSLFDEFECKLDLFWHECHSRFKGPRVPKKAQFTHERVEYNVFCSTTPLKAPNRLKPLKLA